MTSKTRMEKPSTETRFYKSSETREGTSNSEDKKNIDKAAEMEDLTTCYGCGLCVVEMRPSEKVVLRPGIGSESNLMMIANIYKRPDRMTGC